VVGVSSIIRHTGTAVALWLAASGVRAAEPVITTLTDFEDLSVAAEITSVKNVRFGDCAVGARSIPARGRGALGVQIGATNANTEVNCDLTFRIPTRFDEIDHVATFCWITRGTVALAFRIRDARDQIFETPAQEIELRDRWVRVRADARAANLRRVAGDSAPVPPLQLLGYRITTRVVGEQTVCLDDLQVEHRVAPRDIIRGEFDFSEPTRIHAPGTNVQAGIVLENRSRDRNFQLTVNLAWLRPDGSTLDTQRARVSLPASGEDYRSYQRIDFSKTIDAPGLYRLVAHARAPNWLAPNTFESTIAVAASNQRLSRGRAIFFGVRANLLREPDVDQALEVQVARAVGTNLIVVDGAWSALEPKSDEFRFEALERIVDRIVRGRHGRPSLHWWIRRSGCRRIPLPVPNALISSSALCSSVSGRD
jgi:hypothetical protein